jgi:hypothetical protein
MDSLNNPTPHRRESDVGPVGNLGKSTGRDTVPCHCRKKDEAREVESGAAGRFHLAGNCHGITGSVEAERVKPNSNQLFFLASFALVTVRGTWI